MGAANVARSDRAAGPAVDLDRLGKRCPVPGVYIEEVTAVRVAAKTNQVHRALRVNGGLRRRETGQTSWVAACGLARSAGLAPLNHKRDSGSSEASSFQGAIISKPR